MSCCVSGQELLHSARQLLRTIGFGEDLPVKGTMVEAERRAEPRGVKDLNIGPLPSCPFSELEAVGLAGHHDIGEKEVDRQTLIQYGKGDAASRRLHHAIAVVPQHIHGDFANVVFILDDKNKRSLGQHRISPFGVALCAPGLAYRCYILCHQILLRTA